MLRRGRPAAVAVVAATGLTLVGCSSPTVPSESSSETTPGATKVGPSGTPLSPAGSAGRPQKGEPWATFVKSCMEEQGWQVRVINEREVEPQGVNADQAATYQGVLNACTESYESVNPPPPITTETVRDLYRQELATMGCLQKLGIQVDPPPSEQVYLDEFLAQKFSNWSAYAHVAEGTDLPLDEVEKRCPQPELTASP